MMAKSSNDMEVIGWRPSFMPTARMENLLWRRLARGWRDRHYIPELVCRLAPPTTYPRHNGVPFQRDRNDP
jgi:hypothetical protein